MITVSISTVLLLLLAVFLGAILTLTGVALGALAVFRTKKEAHESLFKLKAEKGEAFVLNDFNDEEEVIDEKKPEPFDPFPPHVKKAQERLAVQMAADLAKEKREAA